MGQPYDPVEQLRPLLADLGPGPALDIGFGDGETLVLLAELGHGPLYGYELSERQVEAARERLRDTGAETRLYSEDATRLAAVPDASVDLVVVQNALQYFEVPALAAAVGRVLRRGGHLVGSVPHPGYYLHPRHLAALRRNWPPWWLLSYPRSALRSAIFAVTGRQPALGASAREIGWSRRTVRRFARLAGMEVAEARPIGRGRLSVDLRRV